MQPARDVKILLAVYFSIFAVVVYSHDGHNHRIDEIRASSADIEDCALKHRIDKVTLNELKRNRTFTATTDTQCFAACILRKCGIMLADGTINRDFVESDIASECKNKVIAFGKQECEIAAKILACLTQKNIVVLAKD